MLTIQAVGQPRRHLGECHRHALVLLLQSVHAPNSLADYAQAPGARTLYLQDTWQGPLPCVQAPGRTCPRGKEAFFFFDMGGFCVLAPSLLHNGWEDAARGRDGSDGRVPAARSRHGQDAACRAYSGQDQGPRMRQVRNPHMVQAGLATRDSRRASRREAGDARRVNGGAALTIFCMPLRRWHTGVCFSQGRPLPCWPSVHS